MAKKSPFEFIQAVRNEASKVTWPTRRETLVTTGMVFVMLVIASIFFVIVDQLIKWLLGFVLG
jgi:preprotein translocase subunit SecE